MICPTITFFMIGNEVTRAVSKNQLECTCLDFKYEPLRVAISKLQINSQ
jgi:hypothetical protein